MILSESPKCTVQQSRYSDVVSILLGCYAVLLDCLTLKMTALFRKVRYCLATVCRDSSVGTATRYGLEGPGIESR